MEQRRNFTANDVVQTHIRVIVDEAIADPNARHDVLRNFRQELERVLDTFAFVELAAFKRRGNHFRGVPQNVEAVFGDDAAHFPRLRPFHISYRRIDALNNVCLFPIVKANEIS